MSTHKPVVTVLAGDFPAPSLDRITDRADLRVVNASELKEAIVDTDVLFLWDFFSSAVEGIFLNAPRLRWVHIAAAGVDKLLVPELVESSVLVTNAQGVFDRPMAEYVLSSIASFFKEIPLSLIDQRERRWHTRTTKNLAGTRVLIVGAGGIGKATARILRAVGMSVSVMGRANRFDDEFGPILASDDLVERIGKFEVIVLATPLTPQTIGLLSSEAIEAMRPDSLLVNVGRGLTVDQGALTAALAKGHLAGAILDTFQFEPLPADDPLWAMPNVLVSPHMSSRTEGWLEALEEQFCTNFECWVRGGQPDGVIDKRQGFRA